MAGVLSQQGVFHYLYKTSCLDAAIIPFVILLCTIFPVSAIDSPLNPDI